MQQDGRVSPFSSQHGDGAIEKHISSPGPLALLRLLADGDAASIGSH